MHQVCDFDRVISKGNTLYVELYLDCQKIMITDNRQTGQSLPIPVRRLIAFRFVTIQPDSDNSQCFQWLAFKGASSYIVQLFGSQGIVFREKVLATDDLIQTYCYKEALLEPRQDYIFTVEVEIAPKNRCLDYCHTNNEPKIAKYVARGIKNIKKLDLSQFQVNILAQLDSLLIARDELLKIIRGVIAQGSNSEIICFLNYFLAQKSAFKLLAKASRSSDILNALSEIASQLAAANITLSNYLQLSAIQRALSESLGFKSIDLVFFARNIQRTFSLSQLAFRNSSSEICNECEDMFQHYGYIICEVFANKCRNCDRCLQ